jgi:hypothetical protein
MNIKVSSQELKRIFIKSFYNVKYEVKMDGNLFKFKIYDQEFYVFLKNISPAYYPKYPDIARIQLPFSEHFNVISKSKIPFFILGYNATFDTFTAWNPFDIKERLNQKSNVSLFTRDSFQESMYVVCTSSNKFRQVLNKIN